MDEVLYADQITLTEMLHASWDESRAAAQRHHLEVKKLKVQIVAACVTIVASVAVAAVKLHNETKDD